MGRKTGPRTARRGYLAARFPEPAPSPVLTSPFSDVPTASKTSELPFEIRRSKIQGRGAFATRRIRAGQRIIEYTGDRITPEEGDRRYVEDGMRRHHTFLFTVDEHRVIDGKRGGT